MAGPEEEVDYYAVLNVRNEVKIVFQIETSSKIFDQSCKLYFIAFQLNHNELKAAYRVQTCVHVISYQDPAKMKVRLKKIRPCWHKAKFSLFCKKNFNREPFLVRPPKFSNCHQSSKIQMPSRKVGGLQFFVKRQTPLFLNSYPSP